MFYGPGWLSDVLLVRLTWLAPVFMLVGGGRKVLQAMRFTAIADVTSEEARLSITSRW